MVLAYSFFDRLERTVTIIAQHADWPGKPGLITYCLTDIDDLWQRAELTRGQRLQLRSILLDGAAAHDALAQDERGLARVRHPRAVRSLRRRDR